MSEKIKRPSWDDTYIQICEIIAKRSTCLFINSWAIIVDPENHNIVWIWYNWPTKWDVHCNEVWCARYVDGELIKHWDMCRWAHAEINAIINSWKTKGKIMYTLYTPCNNCAKHIVNSEIKEIVYKKEYWSKEYLEKVLWFLQRLWVNVRKYQE